MGLSANAPWTAFYGNTPASLAYPEKTMYQMLRDTARQYPEHTAYVFMGKKTSYAAVLKRIESAAKGLTAMGIRKGDRVTICMPNTPQALDCFYALNRIGAIPNMIHPLSAAKEIAFYLNFSKSKVILTLDSLILQIPLTSMLAIFPIPRCLLMKDTVYSLRMPLLRCRTAS